MKTLIRASCAFVAGIFVFTFALHRAAAAEYDRGFVDSAVNKTMINRLYPVFVGPPPVIDIIRLPPVLSLSEDKIQKLLPALRPLTFWDVPAGDSCPLLEPDRIDNPLTNDSVVISQPSGCLRSQICFPPDCDADAGNPNGGNVYLGLHPGSGDLLPGRIEFALRPTMVVIEVARMAPAPFILRVTDSIGNTNDFQFAPTSQNFFVGFAAGHGIAQIEHIWKEDNGRFKFTALYLDETSLAAPGPLAASLTWTDRATLYWGDNSHNETAFIIERRAADEFQYRQIGRVDANVTTFVDSNIVSRYTYMYHVIATNNSGDFAYSEDIVVHTPFDHVFTSLGAQDGFVAELNEHADFGWFVFPYNAGPAALRAGDTGFNQQCKAIVAFNTRPLPNGSIITGARLRLKRGAIYGDPFGQLGNCWVDIAPALGFTRSLLLQPTDFQAPPGKARIGLLMPEGPDSEWYVANLDAKIFGYLIQNNINQFRICFERADNNDLAPDYIGWFSGENTTPENRPRLEVLTDSTPPAN